MKILKRVLSILSVSNKRIKAEVRYRSAKAENDAIWPEESGTTYIWCKKYCMLLICIIVKVASRRKRSNSCGVVRNGFNQSGTNTFVVQKASDRFDDHSDNNYESEHIDSCADKRNFSYYLLYFRK